MGLLALLACSMLLLAEPALANKFEAIGSGLSGSSHSKRDWLTGFFAVSGGLSLLFGILTIATPHDNAAFLNYGNWKQSAIVLFVLAAVLLLLAVLV